MRKLILIFALIPLMAFAQYGQRGAGGGSTFYWSLTGQAQKTDSLRIIQGTNMTITQSGNTVTFNGAAGAGSTANVRANTGWTSNGTLARDTLATNYAIFGAKTFGVGGTTQAQNARAKFNVLGRAANDTLTIFSNDGGGVVGDSSLIIGAQGWLGIGKYPTNPIDIQISSSGFPAFSLKNTDATGVSRFSVVNDGGFTGALTVYGSNFFITDYRNNMAFGSDKGIFFVTDGTLASGGSSPIILRAGGYDVSQTRLFIATTGAVGIGTTDASQLQAVLTARTQTPTADTLFMVRNDKNSTLDSTMMVFANGRILRRDTKPLPAGAWLATASNGAALSSSNYMVTYAFDTATAETLTVDFALPPNFIQISNVEIEVVSPNTDGDSVGFAIAWLGRAADEAFNVAFSSPLSGQIDLGTTANVRKILTISGTFDNLAASDRLILKLWRDPSIDNDVAADVHLVDVRVNGNGLLY